MYNLVLETTRFLNIQKPWKIVIKPYLKTESAAEYYEMRRKKKLVSHLIRINLECMGYENARSLDSLIVHEFIHAWQAENSIQESDHGPEFQKMARILETHLSVPRIYLPDTDI